MPKDTFFRLKEEKRNKIENALIDEFSSGSFEEASISNIIAKAGIPRGSFYQYFEDKDDAVKYIMKKFLNLEHEKMKELLKETKGDIFETTIRIYDYMVETSLNDDRNKLIKNILQELRKNNINLFEIEGKLENNKQRIEEILDTTQLNIKQEKDVFYFLRILTAITRSISMEVVTGKISKKKGKETLVCELEILKRGMKKK